MTRSKISKLGQVNLYKRGSQKFQFDWFVTEDRFKGFNDAVDWLLSHSGVDFDTVRYEDEVAGTVRQMTAAQLLKEFWKPVGLNSEHHPKEVAKMASTEVEMTDKYIHHVYLYSMGSRFWFNSDVTDINFRTFDAAMDWLCNKSDIDFGNVIYYVGSRREVYDFASLKGDVWKPRELPKEYFSHDSMKIRIGHYQDYLMKKPVGR